MPTICYKDINLRADTREMIRKAVGIIQEYRAKGYTLTLRQIYYQFVARDLFPQSWADPKTGSTNNERSYKRLGEALSNGRLCGIVDWNAMEDRTRERGGNTHWNSPQDIIAAVSRQYQIDKWEGQPFRPEVWVEKDALEGVVAVVCRKLDIPYFSCRGYTSQTAMHDGAMVLKDHADNGAKPVVLHFGDLDPSGLDMSRDIEEKLRMFMGSDLEDMLIFKRIALNPDQIERYNPPPNPTKMTDTRAAKFVREHGEECWELDALDPGVISALIEKEVAQYRDDEIFAEKMDQEETERDLLGKASKYWPQVVDLLNRKS